MAAADSPAGQEGCGRSGIVWKVDRRFLERIVFLESAHRTPFVPAEAGIQACGKNWVPAFAGTNAASFRVQQSRSNQMAGAKPGHEARVMQRRSYFTSLRPVIFSRLPCMIALYFAFDRSRLSKIFSVSRM